MRKVSPKPTIFRHSSHAEWGHGIIVEETPSKLYVYFEDGGRRPFVNDPRSRRLLLMAELPPKEADALIAKFEKSLPKKVGDKKRKKKGLKAAAPGTTTKATEETSDDVAEFFDSDVDDGDDDE
jgi:hypothetical protein